MPCINFRLFLDESNQIERSRRLELIPSPILSVVWANNTGQDDMLDRYVRRVHMSKRHGRRDIILNTFLQLFLGIFLDIFVFY